MERQDKIINALEYISPSNLSYEEWRNVGMALKAEGLPCSLWDSWSMNDSRYEPEECYKKWDTFNSSGITGGTIFYHAKQNGWIDPEPDDKLDWDSPIGYTEEPKKATTAPTKKETTEVPQIYEPWQMLADYLRAMFAPDENVNFVTKATYKSDKDKWIPGNVGTTKTCGEIISSLEETHSIDKALGSINTKAGAWIRINPTDAQGISNKNITRYDYALVESDSLSIEEQKNIIAAIRLPVVAVVESGGKSVHAIVKVGAKDEQEYKQRVAFLFGELAKHNFVVDTQNKNCSRLSRLPGVMRGNKLQRLISINSGLGSWEEWIDYIDGEKNAYRAKSAYSGLSDFLNDLQSTVDTPYTPTGFYQLDEVLEGGLYEGLYIFGAVLSLGKTAFILQMIDQIAERASRPDATEEERNTDILFFSMEMAEKELISRSLSRITFMECMRRGLDSSNAKTNRGITTRKRYKYYNETEIGLIQDAVKIYSERSKHIYFVEGVGDISAKEIGDRVSEHIRLTGHKPVVVVDYLQILATWVDDEHPNRVLNEKQSTDKSVLEMKRISRDYKIPVISVSSFNREGYKSIGDLMSAFKESGAIEYGADFLAGMLYGDMITKNGKLNKDFDLNEAKSNDPRIIDLFIIKNRNGAIPRGAIRYNYKPMFHYYEEDV